MLRLQHNCCNSVAHHAIMISVKDGNWFIFNDLKFHVIVIHVGTRIIQRKLNLIDTKTVLPVQIGWKLVFIDKTILNQNYLHMPEYWTCQTECTD